MSGLRYAIFSIGFLVLAAGCRIEDRTPTGTRQDEDTIHQLLGRYARSLSRRDWAGVRSLFWEDGTYSGPLGSGPPSPDYRQSISIDSALEELDAQLEGTEAESFDVRIVRTDFRQQGDLAAAWVITRRRTPSAASAAEYDWTEHVVFRRVNGNWRILSVAVASSPREKAR